MKTIMLLLLSFNVFLFATSGTSTHKQASEHTPQTQIWTVENDTAKVKEYTPVDKDGCFNGGLHSTACTISPGIVFADGVSGGCSVNCVEGYFACCALGCKCKPNTSSYYYKHAK